MLTLTNNKHSIRHNVSKPTKATFPALSSYTLNIKKPCIKNAKALHDLGAKISLHTMDLNPKIELKKTSKTLVELIDWYRNTQTALDYNILLFYIMNIVNELRNFHIQGIAYQFVRPENIIVEEDYSLRFVSPEMTELKPGSVFYTPNEVLSGQVKSSKDLLKADLWSLGIVIGGLCLLKCRWIEVGVSSEAQEKSIREALMPAEEKYGAEMARVVLDLLQYDPEKRLSIKEVNENLQQIYVSVNI